MHASGVLGIEGAAESAASCPYVFPGLWRQRPPDAICAHVT